MAIFLYTDFGASDIYVGQVMQCSISWLPALA